MNFDLYIRGARDVKMTNVFLDIQSRRWRQVEGWNMKQLDQFSEEKALFGLRESWSCRSVVKNKLSTLAIAFSCDGNFMASSHLTHEIVILETRPCLHVLRILSAHPSTNRSPWCLTFHPSRPHHLLSGCLGGSVLLWDVQTGKCLCAWLSGISSPINGLAFSPTHPDHFLVAYDTRLCLMHHCGRNVETIWTSKTATVNLKVRLVLHHPDCNRILIAVTNQPHTYHRSNISLIASTGLLCMSVRVLSPQSVVLTSRFVISNSVHMANTKLSVYSIERRTFGQCLCSIALAHEHSVVSLDLSACRRFLLIGSSWKRYHIQPHIASLQVFRMTENSTLEPCCELTVQFSINMARWLPAQSGEGGVCVGTQQGSVVRWGRKRRGSVGGGGEEETDRDYKLEWFPNNIRSLSAAS